MVGRLSLFRRGPHKSPEWPQALFGMAAVAAGRGIMSEVSMLWGLVVVILGLALVTSSLRPTLESTAWYKRRQERQRHGGIGPIRFTTDARLAEPTDRRWRSCKQGAVGMYSPGTMVACVEAGIAKYERPWDRWRHRWRLRRYGDEASEAMCEPFTNILPFIQAAYSVVHGLKYGKLSSAAEDWRWKGEERTLLQAQDQLPSLPAGVRDRYSALLSKVGTILRDRIEPSSEEFQSAMSELEGQIQRDRYLWETELCRE